MIVGMKKSGPLNLYLVALFAFVILTIRLLAKNLLSSGTFWFYLIPIFGVLVLLTTKWSLKQGLGVIFFSFRMWVAILSLGLIIFIKGLIDQDTMVMLTGGSLVIVAIISWVIFLRRSRRKAS